MRRSSMRNDLADLALVVVATSCAGLPTPSGDRTSVPAGEPVNTVVLANDVRWEQLNPARGDQSPQAGTLWGDRKGTVPTGYLIKFEDGFSSPPHIHNVSYRGVVIRGSVHNDDPEAAKMWMSPGSFWTQPRGEVHITAAKGRGNMAYIEIEKGPYLVWPTVRAFDSGERPVNVDASNIVWLDASILSEEGPRQRLRSAGGPAVAFLWGAPSERDYYGAFVKLPSRFDGRIVSQAPSFRAIVISGLPRYGATHADSTSLEPGSYFASDGPSAHHVSSGIEDDTILYVRTNGRFEVVTAAPEN